MKNYDVLAKLVAMADGGTPPTRPTKENGTEEAEETKAAE